MATIKCCDCGGEAEFVNLGRNIGYVRCPECEKTTRIYSSKQNAIKAWNGGFGSGQFLLCPVCCGKTGITDTRADCDSVKRKRKCVDCGYRFITVEIDEELYKKLSKENV